MFKVQKRYRKYKSKSLCMILNTNNGKKMNYQNVENVVIEIRDLLKKEASGILSNLGLKTSLDKISLLGDILF